MSATCSAPTRRRSTPTPWPRTWTPPSARWAPGGSLEPHRTAILAALTITDDLFRTREELRQLREDLERRSRRISDLLRNAAGEESRPES